MPTGIPVTKTGPRDLTGPRNGMENAKKRKVKKRGLTGAAITNAKVKERWVRKLVLKKNSC